MEIKPSIQGLTSEEAQSRLAQWGPNALPSKKNRDYISIIVEFASEPMILLLILATVLYLLSES